MDVNQDAPPVLRRDLCRRHDEAMHAGYFGLLDLDAELLLHGRNIGDRKLGAALDQLLPFRRRLGVGIEMRRVGCTDHRLHVGADVSRAIAN